MVEALPCSGCFTTYMGAHFSTVEMDNAIRFSIASGPLEGVCTCGIVPDGPAGSAVSFNILQGLKC